MDQRLSSPAALRNRGPILDVLRVVLPEQGLVLEIASGSGEHVVYFATALPQLSWQPSDPNPEALASIASWAATEGLANIHQPIAIDAAAAEWPLARADAILCINMVHISAWDATVGLFKGCARLLPQAAPVILYGPYLEEGVETTASNLSFDESLKARNPAWGLRDLSDVDRLAAEWGFERSNRYAMPADNLTLVYRR